jgi:CHASE2 domain-containing sensor protein
MDNWLIWVFILILFGFIKISKRFLSQHINFCNWCKWCCEYWNKLSEKSRLITANLLLGVVITLMLLPFQDGHLSSTEDANIDWMMQMYRGSAPLKEMPPFVLFDIDEYTYRQWQEPLITPRNKLLQLVELAVEGQAKVILIDIDLTYPVNRQSATLHEADKALYEYIYNYDKRYCTNKQCPHIVLVRTFRVLLDANNQPSNSYEQRHSFLDTAVNHSEHVHWASTLFELQHDRVLRRWRLWEKQVADISKQPTVIPSIQLLTVLLITSQGSNQVKKFLANLRSQSIVLELGNNLSLHLMPSDLNRRILYTIPWQLEEGETYPTLSDERLLLNIMSAYNVIESIKKSIKMSHTFPTKDLLNMPLLKESLVVIGGSYEDSSDLYETPLGKMPGTMVLINAVHSLLQYGELNPPPSVWITICKTIFFILVMTLVFAFFPNNPCYGMLLSTLVIILTIVFASFWVFRDGIWLNFVVPLLAVQVRQTIASLKGNPCAISE